MSSARGLWTRRSFLVDSIVGAGALAASGCIRSSAASSGQRRRSPLDVAALRETIAGLVLTPDDRQYERFRPLFNRRYDAVHPALLVLPDSVEDVRSAITWARTHGVSLRPRGGGHSYLGNSTGTGMVLDLRRLKRVDFVRDGEALVDVGGGARLMQVATALGARDLVLPLGSCASVGVGGFILGGGIGLSSRLLGLGCDRLREVELVTADGRVVRADEQQNPELFWACKGGGGGQLGIVTRMRVAAHPAARVSWFTLQIAWDRAAEALRYWQEWAPAAPRELTSVFQFSSRPGVSCVGQFYGSATELERIVAGFASAAGATPSFAEGSPQEASLVWAGCEGRHHTECSLPADHRSGVIQRGHYEARGLLFESALPEAAIETILHHIEERSRMPLSGWFLLDAWGGAVADVAPAATAFPHRAVRFSGQAISDGPLSRRSHRRWIGDFWSAMRRFAGDGMYSNYSFAGLDDWQHALWRDNLPRMLSQKRSWDPDDVFIGEQILAARTRSGA
jgi:FAD/FMN-containing dehydrogenase